MFKCIHYQYDIITDSDVNKQDCILMNEEDKHLTNQWVKSKY